MAKTFDTSRVGGGTYELAQDANGNYNLNSVGFNQVNKLNLPDLKDSKTSVADTTKKATEDTIKAQTTEVFTPSNVYQSGDGDGEGNNTKSMVKEAKVKEATVRSAGDSSTYNSMTDAEKNAIATGTATVSRQKGPQVFNEPMTFRGVETSKQVGPQVIDTTKTYSTPRTIKDQKEFLGTAIPEKTTGLQKVTSKAGQVIDNVKNSKAIGFATTALGLVTKSPIGAAVKGLTKVASALGGKLRGIDEKTGKVNTQAQYEANRDAASKQSRTNNMIDRISKGKTTRTNPRDAGSTKEQKDAISAAITAAAAREKDTGMGSCFIAGTKITMSDKTLKNIENIVVGDKVKGHKEDNTVIKLDPTLLGTRKLYSFNNNEHYFFTSEHPFMTEEGWKSIKPEKTKERDGIELYNQLKGELKISDKLITENGLIEITDIKSKEINNPDMPLYNFNVSNDNSYVADKYIVHNKGGSTRVICTDLHRTGELSTKDWVRDTKFTFKTLSKTHVKGYLLWAEPTVKHMQKYPRYRKMWKHIAQHRANDIAWRLNEGKFDLLGRIYAGIGEPVCWALGNFVSDKQISKYNLTHWRRA